MRPLWGPAKSRSRFRRPAASISSSASRICLRNASDMAPRQLASLYSYIAALLPGERLRVFFESFVVTFLTTKHTKDHEVRAQGVSMEFAAIAANHLAQVSRQCCITRPSRSV